VVKAYSKDGMYINKFMVSFRDTDKKVGTWIKTKVKTRKNKSRESFAMHKHESCDRKRKLDPFQQNNKQKMWILITWARLHLLKLSP